MQLEVLRVTFLLLCYSLVLALNYIRELHGSIALFIIFFPFPIYLSKTIIGVGWILHGASTKAECEDSSINNKRGIIVCTMHTNLEKLATSCIEHGFELLHNDWNFDPM